MILDQLIGFFSSDMGIDLGTANTLVLVKDKGIIINEPSVVAVEREKYGSKAKILAVGKEAKEMVGKTPGNIEAIRPMKDGVFPTISLASLPTAKILLQNNQNEKVRKMCHFILETKRGIPIYRGKNNG